MRSLLILIIFLTITIKDGFSYQARFNELETALNSTQEIIAAKLLDFSSKGYKLKVLKSWKGVIKTDSLTIAFGDRERKIIYPPNECFIIYIEKHGINLGWRTTDYRKTQDIEMLDSFFRATLWVNKNELKTLDSLDYERKFVILTDKGRIDIKDKKVVFNFEGKVKSRENLPPAISEFYPVRYFLVAQKESISDNPCGVDYIFFVNQLHQEYNLLEPKRKRIEKKSIRKVCH